eukprot:6343449-Ditylum_brightwellii.AAC.1
MSKTRNNSNDIINNSQMDHSIYQYNYVKKCKLYSMPCTIKTIPEQIISSGGSGSNVSCGGGSGSAGST